MENNVCILMLLVHIMKKKVLFIIGNMESGGVTKSIINLLWEFDYEKFTVDLMIQKPSGVHRSSLPKEVNIISFDSLSYLVSSPLVSLRKLLINGYFSLFFLV